MTLDRSHTRNLIVGVVLAALVLVLIALNASVGDPLHDSTPAPIAPISISLPTAIPTTISEDSPNWNCLTMGNKICGRGWAAMSPTEMEAWEVTGHETCLIHFGDTTYINCLDGYTTSS